MADVAMPEMRINLAMERYGENEMKKYGVILADPPWKYRNRGNGHAGHHYQMMQTEHITNLPIGAMADKKCVLILWATWPFVPDAMQVIKSWGFEYVTGFPWVKTYGSPNLDLFGDLHAKPVYGTGGWIRGTSEPIFISKRGQFIVPESARSMMGILSERLQHSRKPMDIYDYAEQFPGPYLELFARRRRPGWDVWGNEVTNDIELSLLSEK